jgi:hypothetical protein
MGIGTDSILNKGATAYERAEAIDRKPYIDRVCTAVKQSVHAFTQS